jgi:DUF971 family protein
MQPLKIEKINDVLSLKWNEDLTSNINIKKLRDECPCVHCKGETVIFDKYIPLKAPFKKPGFYEIDKIEMVGNYGINIIWKDGHNTGIYSWEYLQSLSSA